MRRTRLRGRSRDGSIRTEGRTLSAKKVIGVVHAAIAGGGPDWKEIEGKGAGKEKTDSVLLNGLNRGGRGRCRTRRVGERRRRNRSSPSLAPTMKSSEGSWGDGSFSVETNDVAQQRCGNAMNVWPSTRRRAPRTIRTGCWATMVSIRFVRVCTPAAGSAKAAQLRRAAVAGHVCRGRVQGSRSSV